MAFGTHLECPQAKSHCALRVAGLLPGCSSSTDTPCSLTGPKIDDVVTVHGTRIPPGLSKLRFQQWLRDFGTRCCPGRAGRVWGHAGGFQGYWRGVSGYNSSSQRDSSCAGKRWQWGQLQFPSAQAEEVVCHPLGTDPFPGVQRILVHFNTQGHNSLIEIKFCWIQGQEEVGWSSPSFRCMEGNHDVPGNHHLQL